VKTRCQIPEAGIAPADGHELEPDVIVDGAMRGSGTWCYMCCPCHAIFGVGLGTGKGQKFSQEYREDGWRLEKLSG
jgi:hypothetical protein